MSVAFLVYNLTFFLKAEAAEGTVSEQFRRIDTSGEDVHNDSWGRVKFITEDGRTITFEEPFDPRVGHKVTVLYEASNPSNARMYQISQFWVGPGIWLPPGIALFVAGLRSWLKRVKSEGFELVKKEARIGFRILLIFLGIFIVAAILLIIILFIAFSLA